MRSLEVLAALHQLERRTQRTADPRSHDHLPPDDAWIDCYVASTGLEANRACDKNQRLGRQGVCVSAHRRFPSLFRPLLGNLVRRISGAAESRWSLRCLKLTLQHAKNLDELEELMNTASSAIRPERKK